MHYDLFFNAMKIPVLFESDDVVVLNKPSGLMVHADGRSSEYTLADYVHEHYPDCVGVGESLVLEKGKPGETHVERPGIVHRLDRDTSGCIIIAKNQPMFLYLKRQFKDHQIKKVYQAIVSGNVKNDTGLISGSIGRSKSDFRARTVLDLHTKDARGTLRDATTRYKVLERLRGTWNEKVVPTTLVEVRPLTGRTHQIRTHFKHIRHPLLGDPLYGPVRTREGNPFDVERTMLHASQITFTNKDGEEITVSTELPQDFVAALAKMR
jgi:23S rRNA pseudouridine1911/1915/1917 synthase